MPRDHFLYLDDILEAIGNIREYVKGMIYDAFARPGRSFSDPACQSEEDVGRK
jgi:uncharacterized protein with HEPN domain